MTRRAKGDRPAGEGGPDAQREELRRKLREKIKSKVQNRGNDEESRTKASGRGGHQTQIAMRKVLEMMSVPPVPPVVTGAEADDEDEEEAPPPREER